MQSYHCRFALVVATTTFAAFVGSASAQEGALARTAAKEVLEALGRQTEKTSARAVTKELVEVGGEAAVREIFEQVAREIGNEGVENLARLCKTYGIDAIRAAKVAPRITATFGERVPAEFARGALRALARTEERAVIERMDSALIPGALEAAARHPGIGAEVVEKLGTAGVSASQRFDTDVLIRLARSPEANKIASLPKVERKRLLSAITTFMESHSNIIFDAAVLGVFLQSKDQLFGGKGKIVRGPDGRAVFVPETGMIERLAGQILVWMLPVIATVVGVWGLTRVYWSWKWSRFSHEVKAAAPFQSRKSAGPDSDT